MILWDSASLFCAMPCKAHCQAWARLLAARTTHTMYAILISARLFYRTPPFFHFLLLLACSPHPNCGAAFSACMLNLGSASILFFILSVHISISRKMSRLTLYIALALAAMEISSVCGFLSIFPVRLNRYACPSFLCKKRLYRHTGRSMISIHISSSRWHWSTDALTLQSSK